MDPYLVVLRVLHIGAAAFWVGASVVFAFFVEPTAAALGPTGGVFMGHLAQKRKLPIVIAIVSVVAIVAGALLFWRVSGGLERAWFATTYGKALTVGAIAAIVAWLIGFAVMRPGIDRLTVLGPAAASGDAAAARSIGEIQDRLRRAGYVNVALLLLAVTAMAAGRYL